MGTLGCLKGQKRIETLIGIASSTHCTLAHFVQLKYVRVFQLRVPKSIEVSVSVPNSLVTQIENLDSGGFPWEQQNGIRDISDISLTTRTSPPFLVRSSRTWQKVFGRQINSCRCYGSLVSAISQQIEIIVDVAT